jgi:hypothetical protein
MAAMSDAETHDSVAAVREMAERLTHMLGVARALAESGRAIDLAGFEQDVGLLCAKSLDLPPDAGREMRPHLTALSGAIEQLSRVLATRSAPSG